MIKIWKDEYIKEIWANLKKDHLLKNLLKDGEQDRLEVADGFRSWRADDSDGQTERLELGSNKIVSLITDQLLRTNKVNKV